MRSLAQPTDKAGIADRLRRLRSDSPRRWGAMSAHQMVCHVADSYAMALDERPASRRSGPLQRTVVKWLALYAPLPWPRGIRTVPEVDAHHGGTRPGEFLRDVARLEVLLDRFTADADRIGGRHHPIFGRMSQAQWLRWGFLHAHHHLRQFGA